MNPTQCHPLNTPQYSYLIAYYFVEDYAVSTKILTNLSVNRNVLSCIVLDTNNGFYSWHNKYKISVKQKVSVRNTPSHLFAKVTLNNSLCPMDILKVPSISSLYKDIFPPELPTGNLRLSYLKYKQFLKFNLFYLYSK